jgi:hypothetical protein
MAQRHPDARAPELDLSSGLFLETQAGRFYRHDGHPASRPGFTLRVGCSAPLLVPPVTNLVGCRRRTVDSTPPDRTRPLETGE